MTQDALGELSVDLAEFGWFPPVLPSEEGDNSLGDEDDEEDE